PDVHVKCRMVPSARSPRGTPRRSRRGDPVVETQITRRDPWIPAGAREWGGDAMQMTRQAKSSKGKAKTSRAKMRGKVSRKIPQPDARDALVEAGARALDLQLEPAWKGAVKANLKVTLALAGLFADFPLPDDAEPAPVFTA